MHTATQKDHAEYILTRWHLAETQNCMLFGPMFAKGQVHFDNGDALVIPAIGIVCTVAKRSNVYLVAITLGVILTPQVQRDLFNQLGSSRDDTSINSVQSKCGKHGQIE